jgi:hypothetical protein
MALCMMTVHRVARALTKYNQYFIYISKNGRRAYQRKLELHFRCLCKWLFLLVVFSSKAVNQFEENRGSHRIFQRVRMTYIECFSDCSLTHFH